MLASGSHNVSGDGEIRSGPGGIRTPYLLTASQTFFAQILILARRFLYEIFINRHFEAKAPPCHVSGRLRLRTKLVYVLCFRGKGTAHKPGFSAPRLVRAQVDEH